MHTSFIQNNYILFNKFSVSPDSIQKDKKFGPDFTVEIFFENVCEKCSNDTEIEELCDYCSQQMKDEIGQWAEINKVMNEHSFPSEEDGRELYFAENAGDRHLFDDSVLFHKPEYFKVIPDAPARELQQEELEMQ